MALINLPGITKEAAEIDKRVEFTVNRNLSADQQKAGVYAKVQVRHPAASFIATVWSKNGRKWVTTPAQEGNKKWFDLVGLTKEVKDYILRLAESNEEDNSAWYLDMIGEHTIRVSAEASNSDLGIIAIVPDCNLTDNQKRKGMVCKVNIETTIGNFLGYTIWNSRFGESLYGNAPAEGASTSDGQRGNPGYRLSREATAQVLNYLHPMVDFTAVPDVPEVPAENKAAEVAKMAAEGFQPVGDSMFGADDAVNA
jgi:hypothetical protein